MLGYQQHLNIVVCEDAEDAVSKGFNYSLPEHKAAVIDKVVVVRKGTVGKNPTVDLVFTDEQGQKYVVMLTGALLKSIPC